MKEDNLMQLPSHLNLAEAFLFLFFYLFIYLFIYFVGNTRIICGSNSIIRRQQQYSKPPKCEALLPTGHA